MTYRSDSNSAGGYLVKSKTAPTTSQQIGQMAAQGMAAAPSNDFGMIGHVANLHQNGLVGEPYAPGAYPVQPSPGERPAKR